MIILIVQSYGMQSIVCICITPINDEQFKYKMKAKRAEQTRLRKNLDLLNGHVKSMPIQ